MTTASPNTPAQELIERCKGHTPAPWRVGIWNGDKNRKHVVDMLGKPETTFAMLTDRNSMFPPSAIVHSDGDRCEVEANAQLIAAAPYLLEQFLSNSIELERYREALKPFAEEAKNWLGVASETEVGLCTDPQVDLSLSKIVAGDFHRALAVIEGGSPITDPRDAG
jgi:hypothetical protein